MNFVGHIAVGARLGYEDIDVLVGTALPDFAAMARLKLRTASGAWGYGIALHHAADGAFHADGWFLGLQAQLRASFRRDGLPEGAARACAHVGPELLLDGALFDDVGVREAVAGVYERLSCPSRATLKLVDRAERPRWRALLVGLADRVDPRGYEDAALVARRLHTVASRRPRLAFAAHYLAPVAARLREVQSCVLAAAPEVLARVSDGVRDRTTSAVGASAGQL